MAYKTVNIDEVEAHRGVIRFMRRELGAQAFGINQFDFPPGREGHEHDETGSGQEEVYVVIAGSGVLRIDGEEIELRVGDYVLVSPDAKRVPVAGPDGLTWICIGGVAGGVYEPQGPF